MGSFLHILIPMPEINFCLIEYSLVFSIWGTECFYLKRSSRMFHSFLRIFLFNMRRNKIVLRVTSYDWGRGKTTCLKYRHLKAHPRRSCRAGYNAGFGLEVHSGKKIPLDAEKFHTTENIYRHSSGDKLIV